MIYVRHERPGDEKAIRDVTAAAFEGHPYSDQSEPLIIERLREAGALSVSLVAEMNDEIVGHIAFSPVTLTPAESGWFGLGPVSVKPEVQGQGIGRQLILEGLEDEPMAAALQGLVREGCRSLNAPHEGPRPGRCSVNSTRRGILSLLDRSCKARVVTPHR